jgi:tetratricopeptide (TPR) repeat protein
MRFMKTVFSTLIISILILLFDLSHAIQEPVIEAARGPLGKVDFFISCDSEAQVRFNRAMALLHNMMYRQAEEEFKAVAIVDSDCAMAYWGVAMTLFNPLWAEPKEDELKRGWEAAEKAEALKPPTERELGYVAAVKAFFRDWKTIDHRARIIAWEAAQKKLHLAYPDDTDAGALYALAHLATAPKGDTTYAHQKEAGALLQKLRVKAPEHPGLFHYTIHAYDNPEFAERALEVARGYLKLAPDVPHAQHMPSHIFVRLGLWSDSIAWNARSATAAMRQSKAGEVSLHYIHAMDYLMYAYLQRAQDGMALDTLTRINAVERYQDSFASAYGIAAAQARYPLERRQWAEAAKIKPRTHSTFPWDKYPWHESIIYFARGLGAARGGDPAVARNALETLDTLYKRSVKAGQDYWAVLLDAQRKTVKAWINYAEDKKDLALGLMREAANLEDSVDKHPVTPGAVLPARELLGDMLLLMGMPGKALKEYEASLMVAPNRFNSLYGAGYAAELKGDRSRAESFYSILEQNTIGVESDRPGLERAKAFLSEY